MINENPPRSKQSVSAALCYLSMAAGIIFASLAGAVESSGDSSTPTDVTVKLRKHVQYLSSDDLKGRDVANESIHQAADYVAGEMESAGFDVTQVNGGAFQPVNISLGAAAGDASQNFVRFKMDAVAAVDKSAGAKKEPSSEEEQDSDDDATDDESESDESKNSEPEQPGIIDTLTASLNSEMNPLTLGASSGTANGKVIFAGYGITAPRLGYDDYAGLDAKGAIVMVLRKEPGMSDPKSPFDGVKNTRHAYFATKVENAIRHGAAAVLIVNDPDSIAEAQTVVRYRIGQERERSEKIVDQIKKLPKEAKNSRNSFQRKLESIEATIKSLEQELKRAERGLLGVSEAGRAAGRKTSIPVVSISRVLVDRLLTKTQSQSLTDLEATIDKSFKPQSLKLDGVTCELSCKLKATSAKSPNVIGVLPGKGALADQSVVIGAHYDHVGMGGVGSLAPGTVAIHNGADDNASGTATMLVAGDVLSRRLESQDSHRRIVLIAFTGEERGLLGSKHYVENPIFPLDKTAAMVNLDMVGRLRDNELTVYGTGSATELDGLVESANEDLGFDLFKVPSGYGPSDHQSFYTAGVPVLFFFTGLHGDYHRPSDDFDKIDFGGMTRITDIVSEVTVRLATQSEPPKYVKTDRRVQIRRQLTAYLGVGLADRGDHVVISGVTDGSPAENSGLQIGDQLDRLGKRRVRTSEDVMELLRSRKPGDALQIQLLRDGKSLDVNVKLGKRP